MGQFAEKLKAMREAAGFTQKQLAELADLSQQAIAAWERGTREPGWSAVQSLSTALGVDCTAFADCDDMKKPASKRPRKK